MCSILCLKPSSEKEKPMIARAPQPLRSLILSTRLGLVAVPESGEKPTASRETFDRVEARERLATLGRALGLTPLAPRAGTFPESETGEAPKALADLDEAVMRTLEGLDLVWLTEGEIVAAFVIETGTPGWEGLRRLSDLLALHPKLKAPLYAVTLPELEAGLLAEVHRPLHRLPKKPLAEVLRLLDWDRLRTELDGLGERVRYLKPEFLEGISEPVAAPAEA